MSVPQARSRPATRSLRATRLHARIPRIVAALLAAVLSLAGLRAIVAGPPAPPPARTIVAPAGDQGATSFAEAFARAYLSFDADDPEARVRALAPFVSAGLDEDAGVRPGDGVRQRVDWTAVLGERRDGDRRLVTVMAQTDGGTVYLSVPVVRDGRGFLAIAAPPALVGPPAIDRERTAPAEERVEDAALAEVAGRALENYLAANQSNLLADLSPDAVVSLPGRPLTLDRVDDLTWVTPGRRIAVQVDASDDRSTSWTLRYELDVLHRDRWYVRSLQVDPTFRGGS
ncbi:conjugal transfer protein [Conexibacter woesei]|uniref:Conjugal transfer protein n=1 Tax=Conexibacter woesei (strain DSM 14684 / CCUG 47730 / CIP 108061 / JCM 11494 / NBRC 100937 / ID131577) TaxID=469383 RepID=D3EYZ6_CONWI|nr:conjugal transfer protein [Conexibacter woesei]ADB49870.1 hypothetical protein Cwoe_1442 [Conexibacter woesei DSM 14684]